MAHGAAEHTAFAERSLIQHGFVPVAAALLFIREGAGEDGHLLSWTPHVMIEFVFAVHPFQGHAAQHRMLRHAVGDDEGMLRAMPGIFALAAFLGLTGLIDDKTFAEAALAPAKADHVVKLRPVSEGVVRAVDEHHTAAVAHKLDEALLHRLWPVGTVVVHDDGFVFGEINRPLYPLSFERRLERLHEIVVVLLRFKVRRVIDLRAFRGRSSLVLRRGGNAHIEPIRRLQRGFERGGGRLPVVVVAPVDDENGYFDKVSGI